MAGTLLYSEAYEVLKKGLEKGRGEGREEGREEGLAEGEVNGQLSLLKKLVKDKIIAADKANELEEMIRSNGVAFAEPETEYDAE